MGSGSTHANVIPLRPARHYSDAASVVARRLGVRESTARQWFKLSDPASPIVRTIEMVRALVECGQLERAERIAEPIVALFLECAPYDLNELQLEEQALDGRENEAQTAYNLNPNPQTWDTLRRIYYRYIAKVREVIRAGDARWGAVL